MDYMEKMKNLFEKWEVDIMTKKLKVNDDIVDTLNVLRVGGVDISFSKEKDDDGENIDEVHAVVTLVVAELPLEAPTSPPKVVYDHSSIVHLELPYISGYLGFREAPWYKKELEYIAHNEPDLYPQVLLVDGNGILHHKGFGSACHIGVALDIPTIGVAKQLLYVDGLCKDEIKDHTTQLQEAGDSFDLVGRTGRVIGRALKSTKKSTKPLFISVGHKIDLDSAVDIVCRCCAYRIPEPIRQADMISKQVIREEYDNHIKDCDLKWRELSHHLKQMQVCGEEIKRERITSQS